MELRSTITVESPEALRIQFLGLRPVFLSVYDLDLIIDMATRAGASELVETMKKVRAL